MDVFSTPDWESNPSSDKIWKETFSSNKAVKGNISKKKNLSHTSNQKKKLKKKLKLSDVNFRNEDSQASSNSNQKQKIKDKIKKKLSKKPLSKNSDSFQGNKQTIATSKNSVLNKLPISKKLNNESNNKHKIQNDPKKCVVMANPQGISRKMLKNLSLREKMMTRLKAARFRFLNEQIYNSDGKSALRYFSSDPDSYKAYHDGFQQQVSKWPLNPLDIIIRNINNMSDKAVIADFGCGEAKLEQAVKQKVYSFDLVALNDCVKVCDMAHVPLEDSSVDVAVFCLSLMGTNLKDYLFEANRVLKIGGILKIAEVESRFESVDDFIKKLKEYGFSLSRKDLSHQLFYFMDFKKKNIISSKNKIPIINLKPCVYKRR